MFSVNTWPQLNSVDVGLLPEVASNKSGMNHTLHQMVRCRHSFPALHGIKPLLPHCTVEWSSWVDTVWSCRSVSWKLFYFLVRMKNSKLTYFVFIWFHTSLCHSLNNASNFLFQWKVQTCPWKWKILGKHWWVTVKRSNEMPFQVKLAYFAFRYHPSRPKVLLYLHSKNSYPVSTTWSFHWRWNSFAWIPTMT